MSDTTMCGACGEAPGPLRGGYCSETCRRRGAKKKRRRGKKKEPDSMKQMIRRLARRGWVASTLAIAWDTTPARLARLHDGEEEPTVMDRHIAEALLHAEPPDRARNGITVVGTIRNLLDAGWNKDTIADMLGLEGKRIDALLCGRDAPTEAEQDGCQAFRSNLLAG